MDMVTRYGMEESVGERVRMKGLVARGGRGWWVMRHPSGRSAPVGRALARTYMLFTCNT